jgi:Asp-tRNA(Asn)/Glu-tRNA(Gln) amidotransferase C subunit
MENKMARKSKEQVFKEREKQFKELVELVEAYEEASSTFYEMSMHMDYLRQKIRDKKATLGIKQKD